MSVITNIFFEIKKFYSSSSLSPVDEVSFLVRKEIASLMRRVDGGAFGSIFPLAPAIKSALAI
jgi:hypothetical protein